MALADRRRRISKAGVLRIHLTCNKYIEDPLAVGCEVEILKRKANQLRKQCCACAFWRKGWISVSLAARYGQDNTSRLQKRLNKLADDKCLPGWARDICCPLKG